MRYKKKAFMANETDGGAVPQQSYHYERVVDEQSVQKPQHGCTGGSEYCRQGQPGAAFGANNRTLSVRNNMQKRGTVG